MTAVALQAEAVPTARELLPHAEASARRWRNTKIALIGAPLSLLGLFGSALMISVGIAGESSGEELAVLLGLMVTVLVTGAASTAHSVWAYRNDPGCKALHSEQVVRVDYAYMQQLTGYQKQVTYTLRSGARYACFVPNDFGR
jgi:hypothetical protein